MKLKGGRKKGYRHWEKSKEKTKSTMLLHWEARRQERFDKFFWSFWPKKK